MYKKILLLTLTTGQLFAENRQEVISTQLQEGLSQLAPKAQIKSTKPTPLEGVSEVVIGNEVGGDVFYMTNDGQFLIQGNIIETKTKKNLTEESKTNLRKVTLGNFNKASRINFYPEEMKHHVTVFTDIDCGYCRKLHNQMAEYNELGIGISYLSFPRSGIDSPSYEKAVTVWCSEDKNTAMTEAQSGKNLEPLQCDNPVKDQYIAGQVSGVRGTPNIVTDDGALIPTYMPPEALYQKLQQLEAAK